MLNSPAPYLSRSTNSDDSYHLTKSTNELDANTVYDTETDADGSQPTIGNDSEPEACDYESDDKESHVNEMNNDDSKSSTDNDIRGDSESDVQDCHSNVYAQAPRDLNRCLTAPF